MQLLTWNLYGGRAQPPAGRDLQDDFAAALARWAWDVALLQEVPPWWPPALARACRSSMRMALTSRYELMPLRRWAARRHPDLLGSWAGGSNVLLVRGRTVAEHRRARLRLLPERRVVHAVRLVDGCWIANLHAHVRPHALTRADLRRAGTVVAAWAGAAPVVLLGGDCNVPDPEVPGLRHLGGVGVDHLLGRGVRGVRTERLDAGALSDHPPVRVTVERLERGSAA